MITESEATRVLNSLRLKNEDKLFSSHDFIQEYCRLYETEYIDWLLDYRGTNMAFQTVHGLIGRYLSEHNSSLGIDHVIRANSECVHGTIDKPMWWRFI